MNVTELLLHVWAGYQVLHVWAGLVERERVLHVWAGSVGMLRGIGAPFERREAPWSRDF